MILFFKKSITNLKSHLAIKIKYYPIVKFMNINSYDVELFLILINYKYKSINPLNQRPYHIIKIEILNMMMFVKMNLIITLNYIIFNLKYLNYIHNLKYI